MKAFVSTIDIRPQTLRIQDNDVRVTRVDFPFPSPGRDTTKDTESFFLDDVGNAQLTIGETGRGYGSVTAVTFPIWESLLNISNWSIVALAGVLGGVAGGLIGYLLSRHGGD